MKIMVWEYKVEGAVHQDVVITQGEPDSFGRIYCIGDSFSAPIYSEYLKEPTDEQRKQGEKLIGRMQGWRSE